MWNEGKERAGIERTDERTKPLPLFFFVCISDALSLSLSRPSIRLRSERAFHILSVEAEKCPLGLVRHLNTPNMVYKEHREITTVAVPYFVSNIIFFA